MEREEPGPEAWKESTRNVTSAGAVTNGDGNVSVLVKTGSPPRKTLGKGAKGRGRGAREPSAAES